MEAARFGHDTSSKIPAPNPVKYFSDFFSSSVFIWVPQLVSGFLNFPRQQKIPKKHVLQLGLPEMANDLIRRLEDGGNRVIAVRQAMTDNWTYSDVNAGQALEHIAGPLEMDAESGAGLGAERRGQPPSSSLCNNSKSGSYLAIWP
jgi:hypothetical protein